MLDRLRALELGAYGRADMEEVSLAYTTRCEG